MSVREKAFDTLDHVQQLPNEPLHAPRAEGALQPDFKDASKWQGAPFGTLQ